MIKFSSSFYFTFIDFVLSQLPKIAMVVKLDPFTITTMLFVDRKLRSNLQQKTWRLIYNGLSLSKMCQVFITRENVYNMRNF